jgi:uncharacterized lipoprotein YbaY
MPNNSIQSSDEQLNLLGRNGGIFIASVQSAEKIAMVNRIHHTAIAAIVLAASACASAAATVTYANTEQMTDVPRDQADRELMEQQLGELFNTLSSKLPPGQELKVEILDIDLAGEVFPRVAIQNVRVLKGRGDPPRIHLRYSIEQDGKVLSSGERKLANHGYQTAFNRYSNEMFSHEKQLLDDWFRKEIAAAR